MKKYRYLILGIVIAGFAISTIIFWEHISGFINDPISFVNYLKTINIYKGTLIFCLLNYIQIILAFIPGGPFEIVAAYMYGNILGTLICDVVMTLGSVSVYFLVKKFGRKIIELFIDIKKIDEIKFLNNNKKLTSILFLIFLIPGTPKDAISYAVGLTNLPLKNWIFVCFVGRLPAILLTVLGASSLAKEKYEITVAIIILFIILYLLGLRVYKKLNNPN